MRKIYHYYFDFNKKTFRVEQESYEKYTKFSDGHPTIYISTKCGDHLIFDLQNVYKVINGRYIIMPQRDDELAKKLIKDYLDSEINKCKDKLKSLESKKSMLKKAVF